MGERCVEPAGKEWIDQGEGAAKTVTHVSIRTEFKPTTWCADRGCSRTGRREPVENKKERVVDQIT